MTMHGSTIEEEEEEEEEETRAKDTNMHKDVCLDKTLYNGERMNVTVRPTEDVTNSANRRPSRRVSQSGPLKSSLRTSQTVASVVSDDVDESEHSMKRNVSFSSLEIRSYGMTLGPNPSSSGPPISLDYSNHKSTEDHHIESYEQLRSVTPENPEPENPRRYKGELFLLPSQRHYLLMRDAGFSRMQIKAATEEAQRAAEEREKGAKRSIRLDEMREKASRFRVFQKKSGRRNSFSS